MTPEAQVIDITPTTEVETKALAIPDQAKLIVVTDKDSMTLADNTVEAITSMVKEVDAVFKPMADKAFQAHRSITAKWKEVKQPLEDAKTYLVNQVKGYQRKVREEAEAEQRRLAEIAKKEFEERQLQAALLAEKNGEIQEAQAILDEDIYVPPPVVKVEAPKVDGRKYAVRPKARVINKMDIIKTVAMNPALIDLIDINMTVANQKAKSMGKDLGKAIKGLEYYEE